MNIDLDQEGHSPAQTAQRAIFYPVFSQELPERPTDIHVDVITSRSEVRIRYRALGELHAHPAQANLPISDILFWLNQWTSSRNGTLSFSDSGRLTYRGKTYHVRVARLGDSQRFSFGFRIMDKFASLPESLEYLAPKCRELIQQALASKSGLIVITGPTGAGKTTLAYNLLKSLDRNRLNVRTLEDSIEHSVNGVLQIGVKSNEWESAIRELLRCDADAVMMGDIGLGRRSEIAAAAALSGPLVIATTHTVLEIDAPDALAREILPAELHPALTAILGVRLAKHASGRKRFALVSVHLRRPSGWQGVTLSEAARHAIKAGWLNAQDGAQYLHSDASINAHALVSDLNRAAGELEQVKEWLPLLREYERRGVPVYRLAEIMRSHGLHITPAVLQSYLASATALEGVNQGSRLVAAFVNDFRKDHMEPMETRAQPDFFKDAAQRILNGLAVIHRALGRKQPNATEAAEILMQPSRWREIRAEANDRGILSVIDDSLSTVADLVNMDARTRDHILQALKTFDSGEDAASL